MTLLLDWFAVWRAGEAALHPCGADESTRRAWNEIGDLMQSRSLEPPETFLRAAATRLDDGGDETARRFAQVCDALADKFSDGGLSEDALLDMTIRMRETQLPPQLRFVGKVLRSLGALKHASKEQDTVLSLGLDLLEAPVEERFGLMAALLVSHSPLAEDEALAETARCLTEALLRAMDHERRTLRG